MEEFYKRNSDEEKTRAKRRSSILKTPKNRDPFSEIEPPVEITLSKSVRRVSFASSNFVKPFVADPDKNTIWDTTYEEEVNHTNSTQSSQEQMGTKLNSTFLHSSSVTNFETSDMDITKLIRDKENILQAPPVISIVDYAKQRSSNLVVPLYDITTQNSRIMNATQTQASTMEFTCQNFAPYLQETEPADAPSEMELSEIYLSEESEQSVMSKTDNIHATSVSKTRRDMELYQKPDFDKTLLGNGQIPKRDFSQISSRQDFNKDQITCTPETQSKGDMELTCQIPLDAALGADKSTDLTRKSRNLSKPLTSDMEFTCQIPADTVLETDKSMNDMELACPEKLSKSRKLSKTEKTLSSGMEFTCQISADAVVRADKSMNDMHLTRQTPDMEFTCQIPEKLSRSRKLSNTENTLPSDMEFTCQIHAGAVLQTDKSMNDMELKRQIPEKLSKTEKTQLSDMEFTCQIPADTVLETDKSMNDMHLTRQTPDMEFTCQIHAVAVLQNDKSMNEMELKRHIPEKLSKTEKTQSSDMEFTCQIPADAALRAGKSMSDTELTHKSRNISIPLTSDMEFTCRMPVNTILKADKSMIDMDLTRQTPDMEFTCQIPAGAVLETDKSMNDMELTRQIPEKLSKSRKLSKTEKTLLSDMEFTCQISADAVMQADKSMNDMQLTRQTPNMEFTCQIPADPVLKADKSMNDMRLACQIPEELSKSRKLSKRSTSDIEYTCQIPLNNISSPEMSSTTDMNMTLACQDPLTRTLTTCQIKDTNEFSTVENMDITGEVSKVHSLSKTNTRIGCQVPQEYPLTNLENSEISCQIPKLQKNHENSRHDMNETEYMEISYGDLQVTETKSVELGCQISQEQGLSKTEIMNVNQTEMSMENIIHEIDKTKTIDKITNSSKLPTRLSPQDSKDTLKLLHRKLLNQSDDDKVEGTPKAERTFVKKQISQTTPKSPFNISKIPVRSPSWMKIDTPSKKNRYRSVNKEESSCVDLQKIGCDVKNDILFSQKIPNLSSDKNSFYLFKTPEPSFRSNSPNITSGVDDTQLLLHCTYNKTYPNSLLTPKIENEVSCYNSFSFKETENITKPNLPNISNMNMSDADCVARNDSRSSSDTSFIDFQSNKLTTVNDTYVLKGKKHISYVDDFVMDENNETLKFDENIDLKNETPPIQITCFEVKLQEFNVKLGNKLASNNLVERIEEQRIKQIDFMKRFKYKPIHIPKELTFTENRSEGELPIQKNKGNENEPSIEDKVKEHQKRCQDSWKLEHIDGDFYHFSTLSNAVVFTAQIDPSDGKVQSLECTNKLTDKAHPLHRYTVKQFLHKLEDNHVKAAIGKQHDLLSLLDYVQMVRMQMTSLLQDLIKCDLTIKRDCIASFSFFNDILGLYFIASVDVTDLENINYDSVEITQKIGTVNENELKNYLKNCPKGLSFFKEFFQAIKGFLTVKEKRKRC